MTEAFLQYIWLHRLLEGELATSDGLPVVVVRAGELNRDAGPDFFDARVRIGDVTWAGNVEIHVKASDWRLHHHSSDEHYHNVVLHVVYEHDYDVVLPSGQTLPTLVVRDAVPQQLWSQYQQMTRPDSPLDIPCQDRLAEIPEFIRSSYLDRLMLERMERKSADVRRLLHDATGSWENCCYWVTARYFGGKANAYAFEMLAKSTPMRIVAKIKDNPFRVEALLMGQAGLLEGVFADDYPQRLQREYRYQQKAYGLTPMAPHLWKFFRMRPAGFPTIRISQLASLMSHTSALFSRLLDAQDVESLLGLFDVEASDYWTTHYRFDVPSEPRSKSTGSTFGQLLLINAWVPLLFEYGCQHDNQALKDRAVSLLRQIPAEQNRIVRMWLRAGIPALNAAQSQALIQLYNEHCCDRLCLQCQLGYQLLGGNSRRQHNIRVKA